MLIFALHAAFKDIDDDPENIASAALELGMPTIKLYTTYKEDGSYSSPRTVEAMIRRSAKGDLLILCHSEKDDMLDLFNPNVSDHSLNRPPESEVEQVREIAGWTRQYRGRAYIVHTSCGSTIEMLKMNLQTFSDRIFLSRYARNISCLMTAYTMDRTPLFIP